MVITMSVSCHYRKIHCLTRSMTASPIQMARRKKGYFRRESLRFPGVRIQHPISCVRLSIVCARCSITSNATRSQSSLFQKKGCWRCIEKQDSTRQFPARRDHHECRIIYLSRDTPGEGAGLRGRNNYARDTSTSNSVISNFFFGPLRACACARQLHVLVRNSGSPSRASRANVEANRDASGAVVSVALARTTS